MSVCAVKVTVGEIDRDLLGICGVESEQACVGRLASVGGVQWGRNVFVSYGKCYCSTLKLLDREDD